MLKLTVIVYLLALIATVLCDEGKVFHFTKVYEGDEDADFGINFEYTLDNGESFNGKAIPINKHHLKIFLLLGADDTFYWVNFSDDEVQQFSFDKTVKTLEINRENEVLATLKDDFVSYTIFRNGILVGGFYKPEWDLNRVSFNIDHSDNKTFDYLTVSCSQEVENKNKNVCKCVFTTNVRIVSKNNARQHRGKTSYGSDPHEQVVKIPGQKRNCLAYHGEYGCVQYHKEDDCLEYHVTFSDNDFDSDGPVYKHLDQIKECAQILPLIEPSRIDPKVVISMLG